MQLAHLLAENQRFDLWRYHNFLEKVASDFWVSDQRIQFTPLEKKTERLWIKHEDQHPIGSHKGRSIAYQLSVMRSKAITKLVISSSGNAAIALAKLNQYIPAFAFVSDQVDQAKGYELMRSASAFTRVIGTPFPRSFAQYLVRKYQYTDLRPSQTDDAIVGLRTLGLELAEQIVDLSDQYSIFAVTTSGANMLGMYQAFCLLQVQGLLKTLPRLFPVIISNYNGGTLSESRRLELERAASSTGGQVLSQEAVYHGPHATSFEGNTAYAAYEKNNNNKTTNSIVVFTGKNWPVAPGPYSLSQYATIQAFKHDYLL